MKKEGGKGWGDESEGGENVKNFVSYGGREKC